MGIDYAKLTATAQRLIRDNGTAATLTKIVTTAYDPLTDASTSAPVAYPTFVVLTPVDIGSLRPDLVAIAETLVAANISMALISDLPVQPEATDTLTVAGTGTGSGDWIVHGLNTIQPAGDAILYSVLVSRAGGTPS